MAACCFRVQFHAQLCRPRLQQLVKAKGRAHPGGHLHWGGLKAFADGSLGSRTALMKEPYADDAPTRGIRLTPYSELEELVQAADAADLQVCCHPDLSFVHTDMHPLNMQEVQIVNAVSMLSRFIGCVDRQSVTLLAAQASPSYKFGNRAAVMHSSTKQQLVTRTNLRE